MIGRCDGLVRLLSAAYSLGMDKSTESGAGMAGRNHPPEVPEKQLHRWKDEGGALPPEPEPEPDNGPETGSGSESRPEFDDA